MTHGDDGSDTESTSTRYRYTNDILAGALVAFAVGSTAAFLYRGDAIPLWLATVDTLSITTAVVWAFGRGAFSTAAKAVSKE